MIYTVYVIDSNKVDVSIKTQAFSSILTFLVVSSKCPLMLIVHGVVYVSSFCLQEAEKVNSEKVSEKQLTERDESEDTGDKAMDIS